MDRYFQERIAHITDKDFWSSIQSLPPLRPALDAARAGNSRCAYRLLGAYHAKTLAAEKVSFEENSVYVRQYGCVLDAKRRSFIRESADMVLRHEIKGWHSQVIKLGPRIDFNADFGQCGQYGFHYMFWLLPVVEQYALTGETCYRDCFLDILTQYYEQRNQIIPRYPSLHPVYYELGAWAKINLFLPSYALLAAEEVMTPAHREAVLKLLLGMTRSLHRLQKGKFRPGNWQIVGANALFWMGCVFPEFKESAAWRARALAVIIEHAKRDFMADGCHSERCWGYGWMSLQAMLHTYETGLRSCALGTHKALLVRVLKRAFRWYAAAVSPTLESLNYGDGSIDDMESVFTAARRVFPDLDKGPGLLGVDRSQSRILRPSGYAFQTCGDDREAPFLSINFGVTGGDHTHLDLLDFTLWAYGEPLIEEVGRFGSYDEPLNPFFRSPQAHNQIVLEHYPMNRHAHRGEDVRWHSGDHVDFFSARHGAFEEAKAQIRRQIVFVKPHYWVIYDVIDAPNKIFQAASYLHAPRPFRILGPGRARLKGDKSCLVVFAEPQSLRHLATAVDYLRADCTVPDAKQPERHRLVATTWRDVGDARPITFAMLLMPFRGGKSPDIAIRPLTVSGAKTGIAEAFVVNLSDRKDVLAFNPGSVAGFKVEGRQITAPMAVKIGIKWVECPRRSG